MCQLASFFLLLIGNALVSHASPFSNPIDAEPSNLVSRTALIKPRVFIIDAFAPEGAVWIAPYKLTKNITSPGFSPAYPTAFCDERGEICQLTTGEAEINAAGSAMALVLSPYFDLRETYFLIAGIAGVNPACGTLGSVSLAHYAVQVGLEYEVLPTNFSSPYIPLGAKHPLDYPVFLYGTEAFELNVALRDRALAVSKNALLADSPLAKMYRKHYPEAPANQPPAVFAGDTATSDVFFHGKVLAHYFSEYVDLLTNGSGQYCMTAQEDSAIASSFLRGAIAKRLDFSRIILMRTAANFDRPPPGGNALHQLLYVDSGGFGESVKNLYNAGHLIVDDIVENWSTTYEKGIAVTNYIGDVFDSLPGKYPPDIGSPSAQIG